LLETIKTAGNDDIENCLDENGIEIDCYSQAIEKGKK
jgi:hypothetical protein